MGTAASPNGPRAAARCGSSFRPRRGPRGGGTVELTAERHGDVLFMAVAGPLDAAGAAKRLPERDAGLVLCALSDRVREVLRITRFERFPTIRESKEEALASVEG